jgi:electron transfer flavoprotein alpha subunit
MKKILIYLEGQKDTLKRTSYESITASIGFSVPMVGLIIGGTADQISTVGQYGLNDVIIANHPLLNNFSSTATAEVIAQVAKSEGADCIIFAANASGSELAPRVAIKMEAGFISDCIAMDNVNGEIIVSKPVYAGKAQIKTKINTANQVYSLRPNVFTAVKVEAPVNVNTREFAPTLSDDNKKVYVTNLAKNEGKLDVLEADIIVSGGRGIKGPENYNLIEDLANAFGGAVGASRAVVDAGWRPHSEQVGQTGKTVSPTLYVACGISGAIQHIAGMSSSKIILAINKDKDAPIFKVADYGIIGDMFNVIPKLTEKVKHITGK